MTIPIFHVTHLLLPYLLAIIMKNITFFLFLFTLNTLSAQRLITPAAGNRYCTIDPSGETILPNGRMIQPMGLTYRIAPHPYGLALSHKGRFAVTANSGNRPFSITILDGITSGKPDIRQVPEGALDNKGILKDVFMGLAITPDDKNVWVAGGEANCIYLFDLMSGAKLDSIAYQLPDHPDGFLGDMVLTRDGNTLLVCDQINFQLLIADTRTRKVLHRVPVGRYPFGVTLAPDEQTAYVANVGMFAYSPLVPKQSGELKDIAPSYPTSGFQSTEMRNGYETPAYKVPALGDPNVPESFSVWAVSLGAQPSVTQKVKTGFLVGQMIEGIPAVGGSSPNSLAATKKYVFATNGNNDCISVIDRKTGAVKKNIYFPTLPELANKRGVIPFGVALSPDQKRLYVAAAGLNAVAVVDTRRLEVLGYLPVGWFPSKVAVTPDGQQLIVANAKGFGSGPNAGANFKAGPEGSYVGHLMKGSVTVIDIPADADLPRWTQKVLDLSFKVKTPNPTNGGPIPQFAGEKKSPIRHIVFISKENRTYDDVFGQLKQGNGDPELARYGYNRTFANKAGTNRVEGATVMPNHLALAQRFATADNFYVDADHSADGHRWLAATYPNEWLETNVVAQYGSSRNIRAESKAPGQWAWSGSAGAVFPEDYNEAGTLWDHLERNNISFYNFGFGIEMNANITDSTMKYYGQRVLINYPIPGPLYNRSSQRYPTYNMAIPEQFRVDLLLSEFKEKWLSGKDTMPQVLTIMLPQDHGAGERPGAGYPFRESYMADNDLGLGRVVEFLSQTPYWSSMMIVVTEDDAQDGRDHIDAHRSVLQVYSPWAKRNYVGHEHYSFGSIFKTFWHVLGVPYLNQYDATAADLSDFFTNTPDFSPYKALPVDVRVCDPKLLLSPFDANFDWKSLLESPVLDNVEDFIKEK
jgi:YVTN family beta-propeller protein